MDFRKIIADDTRYKILHELKEKDACACSFIPLVKKSQPNVSLHLKKMEQAGVIKSRREGTRIIYSLKDKKIKKILQLLEEGKHVKKI